MSDASVSTRNGMLSFTGATTEVTIANFNSSKLLIASDDKGNDG